MELGFIAKAMRRYWWFLVAFVAVATTSAFLLRPSVVRTYESGALLLVSPPSSASDGSTSGGDDRYLQGEIVALQSGSLSAKVAASLDGRITAGEASSSTTFAQIVGTSIVRITVRSGSAENARDIAEGYAREYLALAQQNASDSLKPQLEILTAKLADVQKQLDESNQQVTEALKPYTQGGASAIPAIGSINPALASTQATLQDQVNDLKKSINNLTPPRVTSSIIQDAPLPSAPVPAGRPVLLFVSPIVGLLLGAVAVVALARASPRVLDEAEFMEILGSPIAAELPRVRALSRGGEPPLNRLPLALQPAINELCVRAETFAPANRVCAILVVGSERFTGVTTLAASMAHQYAVNGSTVLLVDANPANSELARLFIPASTKPEDATAPASVSCQSDARRLGQRHDSARGFGEFVPSAVTGLSLTTLSILAHGRSSREEDYPSLIRDLGAFAHVVVFDGGPLMDAASTVHLAKCVDAIVLAVPVGRQRTRPLQVISRQLRSRIDALLPVSMPVGKPPRRTSQPEPNTDLRQSARV